MTGESPCYLRDEDLMDASECVRVILASASPRRAQLLREIGLRFEIVPSREHEPEQPHLSPREWALRHAFAKAREVARRYPDALVIGADTMVVLGRKVYNKPKNLADAKRMLHELQGRIHRVITGVCILHWKTGKKLLFAETTRVTFHELNDRRIVAYLRRINPLDKAGAYAAQDHGKEIIRRVDGSYSNVVGFPVERFLREMARWLRNSPARIL